MMSAYFNHAEAPHICAQIVDLRLFIMPELRIIDII